MIRANKEPDATNDGDTEDHVCACCVRERKKTIFKVTGVFFFPRTLLTLFERIVTCGKRNGTMATDTKALYLRAEARFKDADSFFFLFEMQHTFW